MVVLGTTNPLKWELCSIPEYACEFNSHVHQVLISNVLLSFVKGL